jgi:hypothetical protein
MGFSFRKRTSNGEIRRPGFLASVRTAVRSCKITTESAVNKNKKLQRQPTTTSSSSSSSSTLSSASSNTSKIVVKKVQMYPMVKIEEFQPYSEEEKKRVSEGQ